MHEINDYFDTFIEVNSVATHVLQYGFKGAITAQNKANSSVVVVMISGNPGEVEYYRDFMSQINCETNLSVIGLSHAGHSVPPKHLSIPPINENPDLYSLNGQIVHKKSFIEEFISKDSKLILIGHSIGCYIILELLHRYPDIKQRVLHSILIFPTIDSMGDTSLAIRYSFLFGWFKYPLLWLAHILNLLSDNYKRRIASFFIGIHFDSPECVLKSATNLLNPKCLNALIYMSLIEFQTVNQLNREAIEDNQKRLTFLYGEADNWCPIEYYNRIHRLYPNCDIRLCLEDMEHAFVMDRESSTKIGRMVVHIIKSIQQKL